MSTLMSMSCVIVIIISNNVFKKYATKAIPSDSWKSIL